MYQSSPTTTKTEVEPKSWAPTVNDAVAEITRQMRFLVEPGQVVELRALAVKTNYGRPHVESGFFDYDHLEDMARAAVQITRRAKGVYYTLNPLRRDLLARRCNRIDRAEEGELAQDVHVLRRRWLLVDADPVRDPYISATDQEKANAWTTVLAVRDYLSKWPAPIVADSGNGYHLLYRVDLPAEDNTQVQQILQALAQRFDTAFVKIDQSVFNPGRICKMPGTLARKGDSIPERPHRWAKLLEVPVA